MSISQHSKCLSITNIVKKYKDDTVQLEFHLNNGETESILWYRCERKFEQYLCDDRCDTVVASLLLSAMKCGYDTIKSDFPISRKLYYNLTYHVIPQLYSIGNQRISRIKIDVPTTDIVYHGSMVATGMSRGVDSFATMFEYGKNFELEEYRINTFTYFQAGAHHGYDSTVGRSSESKQELYENQMIQTKNFCQKYNYPLIVVDSNVDIILSKSGMFKEKSFNRTHTLRNLGIVMLFQKGISRYYYSSAYTLNDFKASISTDMAHYEKWLIPLLSTGSVEFYQSNQDWTRMDKVEKLSQFEECYDDLQVCLVKSGNCGVCVKCKRTLIELDSLGEDVLDKFQNSFDLETYKREHRKKWFESLIEDKDKPDTEAPFYDEAFINALKYHPELIGDLIKVKQDGVKSVKITGIKVNIREFPSLKSNILFVGKKDDVFPYHGECGAWVGIELADGTQAFVKKDFTRLM